MKKLPVLIILVFGVSVFSLSMDSVTVDSVWNSDSSWYDNMGILRQSQSRDCIIGFKPIGQGMAQCYPSISLDSGRTWNGVSPNLMIILNNGLAYPVPCGTRSTVKLRVLGGDRPNVVFRITGQQNQMRLTGDPGLFIKGVSDTITPGALTRVTLKSKMDSAAQGPAITLLSKVYWDALADGIWDDSTNTLSWEWWTPVPQGAGGQQQPVVVKARDLNGLWSLPYTLRVQFGTQPVILGDPRLVLFGTITDSLIPGSSCAVSLKCRQDTSLTPVVKVYWDALADGSWDDSTNALTWVWQTMIPMGTGIQRRAVIVQARDWNGFWSEPCTLTIQFKLAMVSIPGGTFQMGCSQFHTETITSFWMDPTEVTQGDYLRVTGKYPSMYKDMQRPVENVTWFDAVLYCNARSKLVGKDTVYSYTSSTGPLYAGCTGLVNLTYSFSTNGYRLPTEVEWEYACRAGTTSAWYWSDTWTLDQANQYCWSQNNSGNMTQPVAGKLPNGWGLYDMAGNVWERCNESVVRGGSWYLPNSGYFKSCGLIVISQSGRSTDYGFRTVCR